MARGLAILAAIAVSLLAVSGAVGAGAQQTPKRGGTVVYGGIFAEPACLNPFRDACTPGPSSTTRAIVMSKVLEAPFDVGPDLTWRMRLVSEVEYTRTPPFRLTYHIRPDARWSDATPITAKDFVFTHRAIVKHGSPDHLNRTEVRSVRALDPRTVRVVLRSRLAGWRRLFGNILPSHVLQGQDLASVWTDRIDDPKTGRPIGSGPFLLQRWERGRQFTLVRNPRYWGPHPAYLDRLVVRPQVQASTLAEAFRSRELDIAYGFDPAILADARQGLGVRLLTSLEGSGWDHLEIRVGPGGHPALRNKLVRRALAYGLDRTAIARSAHEYALGRQDSEVFLRQSPYFRANWSTYGHSPSESRRLLERAGCRRGSDAVYDCAGEPLRFRIATTAGVIRVGVVKLVQAQLRQVGIDVLPDFVPRGVLFDQILPSGNFDIALVGWGQGPDPDSKVIFGCGGPENFTGYCQRLVTADLDQAERILDADRQARALNRADTQMARDVPTIPLYQLPQSAELRSTVRNFRLSINTAENRFWNAENWWLER